MILIKRKYIFSVLIIILICNNSISQDLIQTQKKETTWNLLKEDSKTIFGGIKHAYSRPFHWKKDNWLTFGGIAAGTALMYIYDEQTSEFFINQEEKAPQMLKEIGWYYGSPQNFFMISAGIYGYGLFAKNEKFRNTGVLIISSAVATGFIQTISKNAFGRARPSQGVGSREYKFMSKESGYHSFPSGHAILSFTASHAIAKQFKNMWVKSGIYAVGLIAPMSRLWEGAHWLTDITLGMVISIVVVDSIDNFLKGKKKHNEKPKISWKLKAGTRTVGLVGTF